MTRYIAIAAIALTSIAGAASAMTNPAAGLENYVTPSQAAQLDDRTVSKIKNAIHSGDTEGEKRALVKSILMNAG